jgi:hypothetical protein
MIIWFDRNTSGLHETTGNKLESEKIVLGIKYIEKDYGGREDQKKKQHRT